MAKTAACKQATVESATQADRIQTALAMDVRMTGYRQHRPWMSG